MISRLTLAASSLLLATAAAEEPTSFWRFSAGAAYRQIGDLNWTTQTQSAGWLLPSLGADIHITGAAGPTTGAANRTYADGYVNPENNTPITGNTWYWGYESGSQLQGTSLVFHGQGDTINLTQSTLTSGDWTDENLDGFGPLLQAEWVRRINAEWSWSVLGSFLFTGFDSDHTGGTFTATHQSLNQTVTDSYDIGSFFIPSAPYHGDFAGPGPTISASPTSRTTQTLDQSDDTYRNVVTQSFDLNLFTLSLGPTIEWHHGKWGLQAGAGVAVNIANWKASQRETLLRNDEPVANWLTRESSTEALWGGFMQVAVHRALDHDWHVSAFVRYDWSQGIEAQVGPSRIDLDLDAFTAGVMIGKTF